MVFVVGLISAAFLYAIGSWMDRREKRKRGW